MKDDYYKFLINELKLLPLDKELPSQKHQNIRCLLCDTIFNATPKSKLQNYKKSKMIGCSICTNKQKYTIANSKNEKRLIEMGYVLLEPYQGLHKSISLKNITCKCGGTPWKTQPERIFTGRSFCAPCNTIRKRKRYQDINLERHHNSLMTKNGYKRYRQLVHMMTRQTYKDYKHVINPSDFKRTTKGTNGYHLDHIISIKYCFLHNIPLEICSDYRNLRLLPWQQNIKKKTKPSARFPSIFYPYIPGMEKTKNFIDSIRQHVEIQFDCYVDFNSFFLTMYNANKKFGIVFITFNEYRECVIDSRYYFSKAKKFFDVMGIRVLFIFEDEWRQSASLVVSKIKHNLKLNVGNKKIYARKCEIRTITSKVKNNFLISNHIQGKANSLVNLGAFYQNELVSVMTFSNPRIITNNMSRLDKLSWEIVRFASNINYNVVGVASKMLKYFEINHEWTQIYSYADRRWSDGNLYNALGFLLNNTNIPSYFYVKNDLRHFRCDFIKSKIQTLMGDKFDEKLTNYQNMLNFGYDRIWDCGTLKFIKHNQ